MDQKLKIGVLGAGHLGKIHLRLLQESSAYELVGFYDSQPQIAAKISREFGYRSFSDVNSLFDEVDVIDIVTPTLSHFELAKKALESGLHVFLEKPITATVKEADELVSLAKAKGLLGMVGQVERFNPAFMAANSHIQKPMFIEAHRLAEFNPRGTDVSVVLDLMIHDIDAILSVVNSKVIDVQASGVSIISKTPDIANARLHFDNGCVANLTASRISMKNMRKSRFFQKDAYVAIDFLEKKNEIIDMQDVEEEDPFAITIDLGDKGKKQINILSEDAAPNNAIEEELKSFVKAIESDNTPPVSIYEGTKALQVAHEIMNKLTK